MLFASRVNSRRAPVRVQALEWPDQELLDSVQEDFPDAGVADAEQARVSARPAPHDILLFRALL